MLNRELCEEAWELALDGVCRGLKWLRMAKGPIESSQRNLYFTDFEKALKYDAIEAGILPLVQTLHELGAQTQFSCEGHLDTHKQELHVPYVACWLNPELARKLTPHIEQILGEALYYRWDVEAENSLSSKRSRQGSGTPGLFLTFRWGRHPHRLRPASGYDATPLIKELVASDVKQIAERLELLGLPRRPPSDTEDTRGISLIVWITLLALPAATFVLPLFTAGTLIDAAGVLWRKAKKVSQAPA